MKTKNSIWINIVSFIFGSLVCYILLQYSYLKIDPEVNVIESLLSVATAAVGLYIASSLQKSHNRNQKRAEYLQAKLDKTWDLFLTLSELLSTSNQIPVSELSKHIKALHQSLDPQLKIYDAYKIDRKRLDKIENNLKNLEQLIVGQPINNNIVNYSAVAGQIKNQTDETSTLFSSALTYVNSLN